MQGSYIYLFFILLVLLMLAIKFFIITIRFIKRLYYREYRLRTVRYKDIVNEIKERIEGFKSSDGMVLIFQENRKLTIYFFDGISQRTSLTYDNHKFNIDPLNPNFILSCSDGYPIQCELSYFDDPHLLSYVILRDLYSEFYHCYITHPWESNKMRGWRSNLIGKLIRNIFYIDAIAINSSFNQNIFINNRVIDKNITLTNYKNLSSYRFKNFI